MPARRSLAVALLTAPLLTGCMAKSKPAPASMAPSADQLESIRSSYKAAFPNAKVGVVTAVLDNRPYALVRDFAAGSVRTGDAITFVGGDEAAVANGTVVQADDTGVTVKFDAGKRGPLVGDAAVKF